MNLKIDSWKPFYVSQIFFLYNGKGITKGEIEDNPGNLFAVQSGADKNGCIGKIDKQYCIEKEYTFTEEPCLTVARTGTAGFVSYQHLGCVVGDSAKILLLRDKEKRITLIYLFLRTILIQLQSKYTYGRKVTEKKYLSEKIMLPEKNDEPDWDYMESFIYSLKHRFPTTNVNPLTLIKLNTEEWKEFYLHKIFNARMGNGIDAIATSSDNPKFNYVSRDSNGNGVVRFIDEIDSEIPFPAGSMSLALGGSFLGSCFIQKEPFYTAQNVGVLQEKTPLSDFTKLFISTLIRNECKIKYQAFGRELNSHFRKDFTIKLPVLYNDSNIVIDETHEFSDEGYIPDWQFMENCIKSLPYSDRV